MKYVFMALIRFYQKYLSPLKGTGTCRFSPTCSAYALRAFETRGFFAGFALMFWRILRCSPLSPCGYDPVPAKGFKTMPLRWSKYDAYRAEHPECSRDDPVPPSDPPADSPAPPQKHPPKKARSSKKKRAKKSK